MYGLILNSKGYEPAHQIWVLISYAQMPKINGHADLIALC